MTVREAAQLVSLFAAVHLLIGVILILGVGLAFGWSAVGWQLGAFGPFPAEVYTSGVLIDWVRSRRRG